MGIINNIIASISDVYKQNKNFYFDIQELKELESLKSGFTKEKGCDFYKERLSTLQAKINDPLNPGYLQRLDEGLDATFANKMALKDSSPDFKGNAAVGKSNLKPNQALQNRYLYNSSHNPANYMPSGYIATRNSSLQQYGNMHQYANRPGSQGFENSEFFNQQDRETNHLEFKNFLVILEREAAILVKQIRSQTKYKYSNNNFADDKIISDFNEGIREICGIHAFLNKNYNQEPISSYLYYIKDNIKTLNYSDIFYDEGELTSVKFKKILNDIKSNFNTKYINVTNSLKPGSIQSHSKQTLHYRAYPMPQPRLYSSRENINSQVYKNLNTDGYRNNATAATGNSALKIRQIPISPNAQRPISAGNFRSQFASTLNNLSQQRLPSYPTPRQEGSNFNLSQQTEGQNNNRARVSSDIGLGGYSNPTKMPSVGFPGSRY